MNTSPHSFHIPVMGIGFTIDTPIKVARYGISSVLSVMDDQLLEKMRMKYAGDYGVTYFPILDSDPDFRAKRITAWLNLMQECVDRQMVNLRRQPYVPGGDFEKYFLMLPSGHPDRLLFLEALQMEEPVRDAMLMILRHRMTAGSMDVNIMTKLDKTNYDAQGEMLPPEYSDAMASLRGFAKSNLASAVVFSAGMNPRLYGYCAQFPDFFPQQNQLPKKKIILKVSDFRSAQIQGKFLAKKGLWISEFRIESGLNCGGHAFATDGYLLGPILEEFKQKRQTLAEELFSICQETLAANGKDLFSEKPSLKVTVQGGVGTHDEHEWLQAFYEVDSVGWGSPFLMVPEACTVDEGTLQAMIQAKPEDYYRSNASPLGVPFNNLRISTSEIQRKSRIAKGRPGSPCYKKYLCFNSEFTDKPICTASRQYQDLKIKEAQLHYKDTDVLNRVIEDITSKDCICEGLGTSALLVNELPLSHKLNAVAICPGPNLAYFSGKFSLRQMTDHIYGRLNLLNTPSRPHMFLNELRLYVDYLQEELEKYRLNLVDKKASYFTNFKENLHKGIEYYKSIFPQMKFGNREAKNTFLSGLWEMELKLDIMA